MKKKLHVRKQIHIAIEPGSKINKISEIYDIFMISTILISLIPLAFKVDPLVLLIVDDVCAAAFIVDYILRLITADLSLKKSYKSFFIYPFTPMAIIDFISILPSVMYLNEGFKLLRIFRLLSALRVLKFLRYSKNYSILASVFRKQKDLLLAVATMAAAYVLVSALIMYNVEPSTFETFLDAVYWATISLTSIGYGDLVPATDMGKIITILSAILGIAVIALPSGIITAGYLSEVERISKEEEKKETDKESLQ
ncbi:MAG: ion transporter [Clostridia bacterium]|nr:ion transporter [Clostridia bacterium]